MVKSFTLGHTASGISPSLWKKKEKPQSIDFFPPLIFKAKMPGWLLSHLIRKSYLRTHYISRGSMGRVIEALYGKLGPSENIKKRAVFWGSLGFGIRELLKF